MSQHLFCCKRCNSNISLFIFYLFIFFMWLFTVRLVPILVPGCHFIFFCVTSLSFFFIKTFLLTQFHIILCHVFLSLFFFSFRIPFYLFLLILMYIEAFELCFLILFFIFLCWTRRFTDGCTFVNVGNTPCLRWIWKYLSSLLVTRAAILDVLGKTSCVGCKIFIGEGWYNVRPRKVWPPHG